MGVINIDQIRFKEACSVVIDQERARMGIGTLSEKTVHCVLKHYLEPNEDYHEVGIGSFYADICGPNGIYEIQTRDFGNLRRKLDLFLNEDKVTIVYPIPATKWLCWLDEETGEITKRRKSPKTGSPYVIFKELYRIKKYLKHPQLKIKIILMDMEETRLLNGWSKDRKKGSTRYDRIPISLEEEINIECIKDYLMFLPITLPNQFTSKDYAKETKSPLALAQTALNILTYLNIVKRVGKQGNSYVYEEK